MLLAELADRIGLTALLSKGTDGLRERRAGHDPSGVLVDVAVALADGAGVARGLARVVLDTASISDFAPGEILIAPQTDPFLDTTVPGRGGRRGRCRGYGQPRDDHQQ